MTPIDWLAAFAPALLGALAGLAVGHPAPAVLGEATTILGLVLALIRADLHARTVDHDLAVYAVDIRHANQVLANQEEALTAFADRPPGTVYH